jgi:hypothetical protein
MNNYLEQLNYCVLIVELKVASKKLATIFEILGIYSYHFNVYGTVEDCSPAY